MPDIDGIELLKDIKKEAPHLNVVMISGHGNIHTAVTATKFGAFDFIEKPVSLDGLLVTVRRALGELSVSVSSGSNVPEGKKPKNGNSTGTHNGNGHGLIKQKTLKKSVVISGQGLHSGMKTGLILIRCRPTAAFCYRYFNGCHDRRACRQCWIHGICDHAQIQRVCGRNRGAFSRRTAQLRDHQPAR